MKVYEEYASPQEKRRAQKDAARGNATGKARGYLLMSDDESGGNFSGWGELSGNDVPQAITHVLASREHLSQKCRAIEFESLPEAWKRAFAKHLTMVFPNEPERRRLQRVLLWAEP